MNEMICSHFKEETQTEGKVEDMILLEHTSAGNMWKAFVSIQLLNPQHH